MYILVIYVYTTSSLKKTYIDFQYDAQTISD